MRRMLVIGFFQPGEGLIFFAKIKIDNCNYHGIDIVSLQFLFESCLQKTSPPLRDVSFLKRGDVLLTLSTEHGCAEMFSDGFRVHSFSFISPSQVAMTICPVWIHFKRMRKCSDGLVMAPCEKENLSDVNIHHHVERVKLAGFFNLSNSVVRPA